MLVIVSLKFYQQGAAEGRRGAPGRRGPAIDAGRQRNGGQKATAPNARLRTKEEPKATASGALKGHPQGATARAECKNWHKFSKK